LDAVVYHMVNTLPPLGLPIDQDSVG